MHTISTKARITKPNIKTKIITLSTLYTQIIQGVLSLHATKHTSIAICTHNSQDNASSHSVCRPRRYNTFLQLHSLEPILNINETNKGATKQDNNPPTMQYAHNANYIQRGKNTKTKRGTTPKSLQQYTP